MIQVLELKGFKSLRAFNAYHALVLGVKMLPRYMKESYESFLNRVQAMPFEDQQMILREAACFVHLEEEEVKALICFCADANGVPYGEENLNNLSPEQIVDIIVAVTSKISQMKIDLVTESEKKKSKIAALTSESSLSAVPT